MVEFWDAGSTFYATDFWSLWDLGIIFVGMAFFIARMVGLSRHDPIATDVAFDILSIEALFLVPRSVNEPSPDKYVDHTADRSHRICSLLSLHPYFGMLIPVLKEMACPSPYHVHWASLTDCLDQRLYQVPRTSSDTILWLGSAAIAR